MDWSVDSLGGLGPGWLDHSVRCDKSMVAAF